MGANDDHVSAEYEVPEVTKKLWQLEDKLKQIQDLAQAYEQGKITAERFAEAIYGLINGEARNDY